MGERGSFRGGQRQRVSAKDYSTAMLRGIHGGRTEDADGIFLKKNQVALASEAMGELVSLVLQHY